VIEDKPKSIINVFKRRIEYLEANDPNNETLQVLKHHVSEQDWKILPT
jgi:hypothetical protein